MRFHPHPRLSSRLLPDGGGATAGKEEDSGGVGRCVTLRLWGKNGRFSSDGGENSEFREIDEPQSLDVITPV